MEDFCNLHKYLIIRRTGKIFDLDKNGRPLYSDNVKQRTQTIAFLIDGKRRCERCHNWMHTEPCFICHRIF